MPPIGNWRNYKVLPIGDTYTPITNWRHLHANYQLAALTRQLPIGGTFNTPITNWRHVKLACLLSLSDIFYNLFPVYYRIKDICFLLNKTKAYKTYLIFTNV